MYLRTGSVDISLLPTEAEFLLSVGHSGMWFCGGTIPTFCSSSCELSRLIDLEGSLYILNRTPLSHTLTEDVLSCSVICFASSSRYFLVSFN